ncbi:hypothetical protein CesoFtcFv8_006264 [Champsocephalus esox]|uniref:Uncharacterized protein n=1 Tax=Champsocephalus esox TaxID=159716 RepID=A0AAN8H6Y0_9TELE|nr:hypothetical protein CesoFtcFv8_006264 [Champsocephalus esox]
MSIRGRHTDGGSLLLCTALIKLEHNYPFGLKTIQRWRLIQSAWPVCVYLSGWQRLSTIQNVDWDHDRSSIPSLANPLSAS